MLRSFKRTASVMRPPKTARSNSQSAFFTQTVDVSSFFKANTLPLEDF
jgi:hypothetical protein